MQNDDSPRLSPGKKLALWGAAIAVVLFFALWILEDIPPKNADITGAATLEKGVVDARPLVALDAGHGGRDPGAVSADGSLLEADATREVARRVAEKLAAHPGDIVVVDAYLPEEYSTPMARANVAARQQADLLLSLHLNADVYPSTRGFQCFPAPPGRQHHAASMQMAEHLVQRVGDTGIPVMGEGGIFFAYYGRDRSKVILEAPQAPEPRDDPTYTVVDYPGCPAVLVEMWHISNGADMAKFAHEEGYDEMAQAVYLAICDYFGLLPLSI